MALQNVMEISCAFWSSCGNDGGACGPPFHAPPFLVLLFPSSPFPSLSPFPGGDEQTFNKVITSVTRD